MPTAAKDFFKAADGHRRAVELLQPHEFRADGSRDSLFFAIYNVLDFTVELYLKEFLAKNGMQDSELWKKEYGRNMVNLFDEAQRRGFAVCLADMTAIIKFLAAGHGEYEYRHVQDGGNPNYFNELNLVIYAYRKFMLACKMILDRLVCFAPLIWRRCIQFSAVILETL